MTHATPEFSDTQLPPGAADEALENQPAKTAGEEDHSNPDNFRGEPADAPTNEPVSD